MAEPANKKVDVGLFEELRARVASMKGRTVVDIGRKLRPDYPHLSVRLLERSLKVSMRATDSMMDLLRSGRLDTETMRELCEGIPDDPHVESFDGRKMSLMEFIAHEAAANQWGYKRIVRIKQEIAHEIRASKKGVFRIADVIQRAFVSRIPVPKELQDGHGSAMRSANDIVAEIGRLCQKLRETILYAQSALPNLEGDPAKAHRDIFEKCCLIRHFVHEQVRIMQRDAPRYAQLPGGKVLLNYLEEQLAFLEKTIDKYVQDITKHVASDEELALLKKELSDGDGDGSGQ